MQWRCACVCGCAWMFYSMCADARVCACDSVPPLWECFNRPCEVLKDIPSLFTKSIQIIWCMLIISLQCALCLHVQFYKWCTSTFVKSRLFWNIKFYMMWYQLYKMALNFHWFSQNCVTPSSEKRKKKIQKLTVLIVLFSVSVSIAL